MMTTSLEIQFDRFFRASYWDLVQHVKRFGATHHEAEEAAQEAMITAYQRWPSIANPSAWTWRVACRAYLRVARRRRAREVLTPLDGLPLAATADGTDALLGTFRVRSMLARLAAQQRRVVAWWLDGYQFHEIAHKLDVKTSTVRSLFRHARARLRRFLHDQATANQPADAKAVRARWTTRSTC
jgi:RNA polymerase sigma factor (sigma-70 family)